MLHPPHEHSQYNSYSNGPGPGNGPYGQGPQSPTNGYAVNRSQTSLHQTMTQNSVASPSASRRSSFDNRMNNLHLDSQVSLPGLAKDRGIYNRSPGVDSISRHSLASSTNGFRPSPPAAPSSINSPISNGPDHRPRMVGRIAPPITAAQRFPYPHPNAPSPTKGFPYAFPDPDIAEEPEESSRDSRYSSIDHGDRRVSNSSLPTSVSSIYSGHSGMVSQHHGHLTVGSEILHSPYSRYSTPTTSTIPYDPHAYDSPHASSTRLGPIRNNNKTEITNESAITQSTPYSRTPELRISHKLAERKRRKEMKVLFDELRDLLPSDRGGKTSKWEILTKGTKTSFRQIWSQSNTLAIAIEHVRDQNAAFQQLQRDVEPLKQQNHHFQQQLQQQQEQIEQLKNELHRFTMGANGGGGGGPAPNGHGAPQPHQSHQGHQSRESQSSAHNRMQY